MPADPKKSILYRDLAQPADPAELGADLARRWLAEPWPPYTLASQYVQRATEHLSDAARREAGDAYMDTLAVAARQQAWLDAAPDTSIGRTPPARLVDLGPEIPRRIIDILRIIGDRRTYGRVRARDSDAELRNALDAAAELARHAPEWIADPTTSPIIPFDVAIDIAAYPDRSRADRAREVWWPRHGWLVYVADPAEAPPHAPE